jgi:hypothetical protein
LVDWVAEGHCYIRAVVFQQLGGFDANLQYSEGVNLAQRVHAAGQEVVFSPRVWTRHLEIYVRNKTDDQLRSETH